MPEPVSDTPHCDHFEVYGYGVVWPIEISLEHFDDCLPPAERLFRWQHFRGMANRGIDCDIQHGHLGRECTCGIPQYGPGLEHAEDCPRREGSNVHCTYPREDHGDGRGCGVADCVRHGGRER